MKQPKKQMPRPSRWWLQSGPLCTKLRLWCLFGIIIVLGFGCCAYEPCSQDKDDKAKKGPKGMKPKPKKKVIKPSKAPLKAPRKDEKKDPGKDEKKDEKDDEKMDEKEDEKKDEQPGTVFAGRWAPAFPPASFRFEAAREAYEQ